MALYVTEHTSWSPYRQGGVNQQINGPSGSYNLSSASTGGRSPQAGTKYIRVVCDGAGAMLLSVGLGSTVSLTSTNAFRISPNCDGEWFSVSTGNLIQASASTS